MNESKITFINLLKPTVIYMFGSLSRKGISLLLLPLYTRALASSGYGALAMLTIYGGILVVVFNFGLESALTVQFNQYNKSGDGRLAINTVLNFLILVILVAGIVLNLAVPLFAGRLLPMGNAVIIIRLYFVLVLLNIFINFHYTVLRLHFKNTRHLFLSLLNFILTVFLTLLFVLYFRWGIFGVILAMLIPAVLTTIYFILTWPPKFQFDFQIFKRLFKFGIWLVPGNLGALIYNFSDRLFIQKYFNISQVGIYSLGTKISDATRIFFLKPFRHAYGPYVFQQDKGLEHGINLGLKFLLLVSGLAFLSISLASYTIIKLMATKEFILAASVVPLLILAEVSNGIIQILATGIHIAGKSYIDSSIVWIGAVLNIGLNFLLIPRSGIMGAALATLATYSLMMALYYFYSRREIKFKLDVFFLMKFGAGTALLYFVGNMLIQTSNPVSLKILIYIFINLCFMILAYFLLNLNERAKMRSLIFHLKELSIQKKKKIVEKFKRNRAQKI